MIGGADMNETRVHKGDVIRYVMESCGLINPDEIVMIGDRENDMNGAKQKLIWTASASLTATEAVRSWKTPVPDILQKR